jgi:hypothetical protein
MYPCYTWKLCCSPLNIFVELENPQNKLPLPCKGSLSNKKFTSQKGINNKIHTSCPDLYSKYFLSSDSPESLPQHKKISLESFGKVSARSNNWIWSYA